MTSYVALIHKDKGTEYGVSFPDLPGCISAGTTIDEAIQMAREALALHLEGMIADGEVLPVPSGAEAIRANEDAADAILALVDVPDDAKVERINLTVPKLSLARFDSYAARHSFNRSNLFVHAVEKLIDQESHASASRDQVNAVAHLFDSSASSCRHGVLVSGSRGLMTARPE